MDNPFEFLTTHLETVQKYKEDLVSVRIYDALERYYGKYGYRIRIQYVFKEPGTFLSGRDGMEYCSFPLHEEKSDADRSTESKHALNNLISSFIPPLKDALEKHVKVINEVKGFYQTITGTEAEKNYIFA